MTEDYNFNIINATTKLNFLLKTEDFGEVKIIHNGEGFIIDLEKLVNFLKEFKK